MATRQSFGFGGAFQMDAAPRDKMGLLGRLHSGACSALQSFGFSGAAQMDAAPQEMSLRTSGRLPTVEEEPDSHCELDACSPFSVSRASTAASLEDATIEDVSLEDAPERRDAPAGAMQLRRTGPGALLHALPPRRDTTLALDLASECAHVEARWGRVQAIGAKPWCLEQLRRQKMLRRAPIDVLQLQPGEDVELVD